LVAITQPVYSPQLSGPEKSCSVVEDRKQKSPDLEQALAQVVI